MSDNEIQALAAEFIAADWTPDRYYRDMDLVAFVAAVEARAKASAWQPIETAPKDEPVLLAWRNWADDEWVMEAGFAATGNTCPPGSGASNGGAHGSATHWQPLPAPPEAA